MQFNVELGQAMESQVFAPLAQWISNHTDAVVSQIEVRDACTYVIVCS